MSNATSNNNRKIHFKNLYNLELYTVMKIKNERRKDMFCRFCGEEIQEGTTHVCTKKVSTDWKGKVLEFLKNPIDTMKDTYGDANTKERFILGGVYYGILFLSVLALSGKMGDFGDALVTALVSTFVFAIIKAAYAGFLWMFGKKNGVSFGSIFSHACLATIPQTICILVMVVFSLLNFYVGVLVALVLHLVLQITFDMVLMECVFQGEKNFGYWMYVAFCAVLMCVLYVVLKSVLVSAIEDFTDSLLRGIF